MTYSKKSKHSKQLHKQNIKHKHAKQSGHNSQVGGGDFIGTLSSKPADFNTVFNTPMSDLRDPVTFATRNFGCRQPMWGPDCI